MYLLHKLSKKERQDLLERAKNPPEKLQEAQSDDDVGVWLAEMSDLRDDLVRKYFALRRETEELERKLERFADPELPGKFGDYITAATVQTREAGIYLLRAVDALHRATSEAWVYAGGEMLEAADSLGDAEDLLRRANCLVHEAEFLRSREMLRSRERLLSKRNWP